MQVDHASKLPEHEAAQNDANGDDRYAPPCRRDRQQTIPADRRNNHQRRHDEQKMTHAVIDRRSQDHKSQNRDDRGLNQNEILQYAVIRDQPKALSPDHC